jgi:hypothetical protein
LEHGVHVAGGLDREGMIRIRNLWPALQGALAFLLVWSHPGGRGIVYNVRASPSLSLPFPWPIVATTTNRFYLLSTASPAMYFTVTASNTLNGVESKPATR